MPPRRIPFRLIAGILLLVARLAAATPQPPAIVPGLRLTCLAQAPDLVHPIGVTVLPSGRVVVLESSLPPSPSTNPFPAPDRLQAFEEHQGDGRWVKIGTVADGLRQGLNLAAGREGDVFVVARTNVTLFADRDGDGVFETRTELLHLETSETHPHHCLVSLAVSPDGWLYVGRGHTGGHPWALRARDGSTLRGFGDGGSVVRLRTDGSRLEAFATGFWNPFGLALDAAGQLFATDNDPEARGPNRVLHLVRGGDYGYVSRHGRWGRQAFQAWNGELPGTLPYLGGLGEAPGTLLSTDFAPALAPDGAPALLVALWGEGRIDRVILARQGASYTGRVERLVTGDDTFRPVALAAGPDGRVFLTDWGSRTDDSSDTGRLWELQAEGVKPPPRSPPSPARAAERPATQRAPSRSRLLRQLEAPDPFLRATAADELARSGRTRDLLRVADRGTPLARTHALVALRRKHLHDGDPRLANQLETLVRRSLQDPEPRVRHEAMRFAVEVGFTNLAGVLRRESRDPRTSPELFLAALEAETALARRIPGHPEYQIPGHALKSTISLSLLEECLFDPALAPPLAAAALPRLPAEAARRHVDQLAHWATHDGTDAALRRAAVWALGFAAGATAAQTIEAVAARDDLDPDLRADAIVARGLAMTHEVAFAGKWTGAKSPALRHAARLILGKNRDGEAGTRPASTTEWQQRLATGGDRQRGRRLFLSAQLGCARCHVAEGRGAAAGPDLSGIGASSSRARLVESIVEPSREIVGDFRGYALETRDGAVVTGLQGRRHDDGSASVLTFGGQEIRLPAAEVESLQPLPGSLMPDGLVDVLSVEDFRDLLAYLESCR